MISWNPELLDKHIAPEISKFTEASIPDLQKDFEQSKYWLTNHFLNNSLRRPFKTPTKQYVQNFIFRAEVLFRLFHEARESTLDYLEENNPNNPAVSKYYRAISIWETVFLNWAVAFDLVIKLNDNKKLFESGDNSQEERLHLIQNEIKHCGGSILGGHWTEASTIPIWLTNTGISSHRNSITFDEITELVKEVAKFANEIQDPITFSENNNKDTQAVSGPEDKKSKEQIFDELKPLIAKYWNEKEADITLDTSFCDDLRMGGDDGVELFEMFAEHYNFDWDGIDFGAMFGIESGWSPFAFIPPKYHQNCSVRDIVNSVDLGKWAGDPVRKLTKKEKINYVATHTLVLTFLILVMLSIGWFLN